MKDYTNPKDRIGESGILKQLSQKLREKAMQAEMTNHLGNEKNASPKKKTSNTGNGIYKKRVKEEFTNLDITFPAIGKQNKNDTQVFGLVIILTSVLRIGF